MLGTTRHLYRTGKKNFPYQTNWTHGGNYIRVSAMQSKIHTSHTADKMWHLCINYWEEAKWCTVTDGDTVRVTVAVDDCSSVTETSPAAEADNVLSSQTVRVTVPVLHCANVSATSSYTARLRTNLVFMFATYTTNTSHTSIHINNL